MPYNQPAPEAWSVEEEELLRKLWLDGKRVRVIGERLGRSKAAIWRKRRSLELPPRFEPREAAVPSHRERPRPLAPGASTLPPLASEER